MYILITNIKKNEILRNNYLQGIFSIKGAATARRIQETMSDSANKPQYAIRADRLLIPDTTVWQAVQAHPAQHEARHDAAHIFDVQFNIYLTNIVHQKSSEHIIIKPDHS